MGERDTLRIAMSEDAASIASRIAADLIPRHRVVHESVQEYNRAKADFCRSVEETARDLSDRLPGAQTRIEGTAALVRLHLEPGEIRIGIQGDFVDITLHGARKDIAAAVVCAVSRFLPIIQTPEGETGEYVDMYEL
ncbi:hypothetical protein [Streptomyces olivaceus]|uniref:hypothetical protein n=1 Tax=Streptomyces olivaceus TaxID=47716 RepID=UPI0036EA55CC